MHSILKKLKSINCASDSCTFCGAPTISFSTTDTDKTEFTQEREVIRLIFSGGDENPTGFQAFFWKCLLGKGQTSGAEQWSLEDGAIAIVKKEFPDDNPLLTDSTEEIGDSFVEQVEKHVMSKCQGPSVCLACVRVVLEIKRLHGELEKTQMLLVYQFRIVQNIVQKFHEAGGGGEAPGQSVESGGSAGGEEETARRLKRNLREMIFKQGSRTQLIPTVFLENFQGRVPASTTYLVVPCNPAIDQICGEAIRSIRTNEGGDPPSVKAVQRRRRRKLVSFVWHYFTPSQDRLSARCKLCLAWIKTGKSSSTTGLITHLRHLHNHLYRIERKRRRDTYSSRILKAAIKRGGGLPKGKYTLGRSGLRFVSPTVKTEIDEEDYVPLAGQDEDTDEDPLGDPSRSSLQNSVNAHNWIPTAIDDDDGNGLISSPGLKNSRGDAKKRCRQSAAWRYFTPLVNGNSSKCKVCKSVVKTNGGNTSGMIRHLQAKHPQLSLRPSSQIPPAGEEDRTSLPSKILQEDVPKVESEGPLGPRGQEGPLKHVQTVGRGLKASDVKRRYRYRYSSAWKYFNLTSDRNYAKCKVCKRLVKTVQGTTTGMIRHLQLHHPSLNLKRRSPIPLCEYHPVDPDTFSPPDGSQENFSNDATKVEDPLGTTPVPDTDMSTNSKFEDDGGGPSTSGVKKKRRHLRSAAWRYFHSTADRSSAKCKICNYLVPTFGGSTSGLIRHMEHHHPHLRIRRISPIPPPDMEDISLSSPDVFEGSSGSQDGSVRRRKLRSKVWRYFTPSADRRRGKCLICNKILKMTNGSTMILIRHLHGQHPDLDMGRSVSASPPPSEEDDNEAVIVKTEEKEDDLQASDSPPILESEPTPSTSSPEKQNLDEGFNFCIEDNPNVKRRALRSKVWEHFTPETEAREYATCNICQATLKATNGSTTALLRHMDATHPEFLVRPAELRRRKARKDKKPQEDKGDRPDNENYNYPVFRRKATSFAWKYFTPSEDRSQATCTICNSIVKVHKGSTTGMTRHLSIWHNEVCKKKEPLNSGDIIIPGLKEDDMLSVPNKVDDKTSSILDDRKPQRKLFSSAWSYFIPSADRKSAKCRLCSSAISTAGGHTTGLIAHLRTQHGAIRRGATQISISHTISKTSSKSTEASRLSREVLGRPRLPCPDCKLTFRDNGRLRLHRISAHNAPKFSICELCGRSYSNAYALSVHRSEVHLKEGYHCVQCDKYFRHQARYEEHLSRHSEERPFTCEVCGKTFKNQAALKVHQIIHNLRFECDVCGRKFARRTDVTFHMGMHTGKTFVCDFCGYQFHSVKSMRKHVKNYHTGKNQKKLYAPQKRRIACRWWKDKEGNIVHAKNLQEGGTQQRGKRGSRQPSTSTAVDPIFESFTSQN